MNEAMWQALGIAPTDDIGAIRSAYARALKQLDVDIDPQGYIALRNARDLAIHEVRIAAQEATQDQLPADITSDDSGTAAALSLPTSNYEEHFATLTALLMPNDDSGPTAIDAALLRVNFDALLLDPRMQEIAFAARAEAQLAELIANALPLSAPLIEPAIRAFGWNGAVRVDTPPAIAAVLDAATPPRTDQHSGDAGQPSIGRLGAEPASVEDDESHFYADRYAALVALLVPQGDDPPPQAADDRVAICGHFSTLLTDPRMELVTFRVGAEAQLAQLIAYAIPRSDCIVPMAIDFFDWQSSEDRIDQAEAAAYILHRARGLRFRDAVESPNHEFHAAWDELSTPMGEKRRVKSYVHPSAIHRLLTAIRQEQPLLEQDLNPGRVEMWDQKLVNFDAVPVPSGATPTPTPARVVLWIFGILFALSLIGQLAGRADIDNATVADQPAGVQSEQTGATADSTADIDPVLAEIGGNSLTTAGLHFTNPALASVLEAKWAVARSQRVGVSDFQRDIEKLLLDRIAATVLNTSDPDLIVEYQRQRVVDLKALASAAPGECVELGRPGKVAVGDVPINFSIDRKAIYAKILNRNDRITLKRASVDPMLDVWIVSAVAREIGVTPDQARQMLANQGGTNSEQCRARIAELQTLLALPVSRNAPLLRFL
jgi:hypothetical protein